MKHAILLYVGNSENIAAFVCTHVVLLAILLGHWDDAFQLAPQLFASTAAGYIIGVCGDYQGMDVQYPAQRY